MDLILGAEEHIPPSQGGAPLSLVGRDGVSELTDSVGCFRTCDYGLISR